MPNLLSAAAGPCSALLLMTQLAAQIYVPATSQPNLGELNSRSNYPLMRTATRAQIVLAQGELGGPASLTQLALRYDGPAFGTGGGTLGQIDVYLGAAAVAPEQSGAVFAANVQGSLTHLTSTANLAFAADVSPNPSPWGGPNGELLFVFNAPYVYGGGPLVVELRSSGNSNGGVGAQNCLLDAEEDPATGAFGGSTSPNGTGCGGATLAVTGQLAPFGSIACYGSGFGANLPVVCILGGSRTSWGALPLPLDLGLLGGDGCSLYNDWLVDLGTSANQNGDVPAYTPALTWPVPPMGSLAGAQLQFQILAAKPGNNLLGVATTNNVQVTLGSFTPLVRGYAAHFHHLDANAAVASLNLPATFAMRFN